MAYIHPKTECSRHRFEWIHTLAVIMTATIQTLKYKKWTLQHN